MRERDYGAEASADERAQFVLGLGEAAGGDRGPLRLERERLRLREGVPAASLPVEDLPGLVDVDGERAVLTRRGRLLANEVALRLR